MFVYHATSKTQPGTNLAEFYQDDYESVIHSRQT